MLLLDEPTNHLDMTSKDVLKNALLHYNGTLVIVSHDRDFLQGLTDKVFEFSHRQVKLHLGDIQEYLEERKRTESALNETSGNVSETPQNKATANKVSWEEQKRKESLIRKTERRITQLEQEIQAKEKELSDYNEQLSNPNADPAKMDSLYKNYQQLQTDLEHLMQEWEEASMELEGMR